MSPPLGMGITDDSFQDEGNTAVFIERLKSLVTEGALLYAANLSILPVMPSGPQAFVTSILLVRTAPEVQTVTATLGCILHNNHSHCT